MERIGIIGLGRMGAAFAARLAAQGADVIGWTRSGLTDARAADLGIRRAATLSELTAGADVILTSLYDDAAVADVLDHLLTHDLNGRLIIETSTAAPSVLSTRMDAIAGAGADAVDAPVSGGPDLVAAGQCGFFVGGTAEAADRALAALTTISERVFHVGPIGTGMVMKVVNNSMLQTYAASLVEQVRVAKRAGLSLEMVMKILCSGPAGIPMIRDRLPKILGEDTTAGFTISGILKDNLLFQRVAQEFDVDTPTLAVAEQVEREAIASGMAEADPARLIAEAYARA